MQNLWESVTSKTKNNPSSMILQKVSIVRPSGNNTMMAAEFAPFDGEWWHFSYGDREWAKFWNKNSAIYGPITPFGISG